MSLFFPAPEEPLQPNKPLATTTLTLEKALTDAFIEALQSEFPFPTGIVVSGAGITAVNGTYIPNGTSGSGDRLHTVWTKDGLDSYPRFTVSGSDPGRWTIAISQPFLGAGAYLGPSFELGANTNPALPFTWEIGGFGQSPAPTSVAALGPDIIVTAAENFDAIQLPACFVKANRQQESIINSAIFQFSVDIALAVQADDSDPQTLESLWAEVLCVAYDVGNIVDKLNSISPQFCYVYGVIRDAGVSLQTTERHFLRSVSLKVHAALVS